MPTLRFLQNFLKGSMKIALGIAPVVKMLQAGVNISLGTDNHIVNNPVYCATAASDVATVIVDGQLMVEDGKLLCCDE
jgi:cytosine/adenosine deaminase-related metal-dependent hydrolase